MSFLESVSGRLYEIRKEMKLTQKEMGEIMGVSRASYSLYENGKLPIDIVMLDKLRQKTGYSLDYLLGYSEKETQNDSLAKFLAKIGLSQEAFDKLCSETVIQRVINHILCHGAAMSISEKAAYIHDVQLLLKKQSNNLHTAIKRELKNRQRDAINSLFYSIEFSIKEDFCLSDTPLSDEPIEIPTLDMEKYFSNSKEYASFIRRYNEMKDPTTLGGEDDETL